MPSPALRSTNDLSEYLHSVDEDDIGFDHATPSSASTRISTPKRKWSTRTVVPPTPAKKRSIALLDGVEPQANETSRQRWARTTPQVKRLYQYSNCPLPPDHIRLLLLKPAPDLDADIIIELKSFPIASIAQPSDECQFTALSYNWGEGDESRTLLVDLEGEDASPTITNIHTAVNRLMRMKHMHIKPNLYAFLREFRDPSQELALWVDRICINQQDSVEKQNQVSKMNIIYSNATNVSIWLGSADEHGKTDRAMDFIGNILRDDTGQVVTAARAKSWSELLYLMRRRWFSRRWVIQELALARHAEVRCGSKAVHWRDFSDAVSIFALHFDGILKIIKDKPGLEKDLEGIKDMTPFGARILVDVLANTFQKDPDGSISAPRQGLESLISSLSTFDTSDPRDTVYTLLNLAKETITTPALRPPAENKSAIIWKPPLVPDYTIDLLEVYTNFVEWCVRESKSLDIICRHWALPEVKGHLDQLYPRLVELPSWIKTVHYSAYGAQTEGFGGRRTGDSFVGTPESRCYNASLGRAPEISFGRDQKNPGLRSRNTIIVRGVRIGKVVNHSHLPEGIITKQALESLGHDGATELSGVPDPVWRTLVADRDPGGKMPPAWYHRACITCLVADTSGGNIDTNYILQEENTTKVKANYLKRVQAVCWNRTFIECEGGEGGDKRLVGIGPGECHSEDIVCILFGCSVPCVLRKARRGVGERSMADSYHLVGEAFILGQMDGEAIHDLQNYKWKEEDFQLS